MQLILGCTTQLPDGQDASGHAKKACRASRGAGQ